MNVKSRKWNNPNRKWIYSLHFKASEQIMFVQYVSHFPKGAKHHFLKQEKESSKQEMDLSYCKRVSFECASRVKHF